MISALRRIFSGGNNQAPAAPVEKSPREDWQINGASNAIDIPPSVKIDNVNVQITGNGNRIKFGENCILSGLRIMIQGDRHTIDVANHVQLRGGCLWFEDSDCALTIGEFTTSEGSGIALTEIGSKITIGRDCMFSYDVDLRVGDSHSILDAATGERINHAQDIVIGNHVWIGAHTRILKGVSLSDNTIVGTGAIVVKGESRTNVVIAGNPGKVVKEGVNWCRERLAKKV